MCRQQKGEVERVKIKNTVNRTEGEKRNRLGTNDEGVILYRYYRLWNLD